MFFQICIVEVVSSVSRSGLENKIIGIFVRYNPADEFACLKDIGMIKR